MLDNTIFFNRNEAVLAPSLNFYPEVKRVVNKSKITKESIKKWFSRIEV
jgi:hypothetical protein